MCMKINYEFVLTEVGGEKMLVPAGASSVRYKGIITLNDTAESIWKLLPEADTEEDIARAIADEYEVSYETALADTREFIGQLVNEGIVSAE